MPFASANVNTRKQPIPTLSLFRLNLNSHKIVCKRD